MVVFVVVVVVVGGGSRKGSSLDEIIFNKSHTNLVVVVVCYRESVCWNLWSRRWHPERVCFKRNCRWLWLMIRLCCAAQRESNHCLLLQQRARLCSDWLTVYLLLITFYYRSDMMMQIERGREKESFVLLRLLILRTPFLLIFFLCLFPVSGFSKVVRRSH